MVKDEQALVGVALIDDLIAAIGARMPSQVLFMRRALQILEPAELEQLTDYIATQETKGEGVSSLAETYCFFVKETIREQMHFRRHGTYRHRSLGQLAETVYQDPNYMRRYMTGLALSGFLWSNHILIRRFFLQHLPTNEEGVYLEVGPGHGMHLVAAMQISSYSRFVAIDISPASVHATKELIRRRVPSRETACDVICADFTRYHFGGSLRFNAIVMGEVLEHVEDPRSFLQTAHDLGHAGSFFYISTAVNAPEIDHIHLFSCVDDLRHLVKDVGLEITRELVLPYPGKTLADCEKGLLPQNVAMVLRSEA